MANPRINPSNSNQNSRQAMSTGHPINARSNPGQTTRSAGQLSSYGVARSGMNQIREGDIVRGEISDLRNNEITITLENNTLIKGQIADSSSLSIGQTAAFRMDTVSPTGLFIEAIPNSFTETELTLINKALDEAGLPATERNQSAVKALMDNLLPINKQSIQHLMQQAYDFSTEDMETLCIMNRQHLEITRDNVAQLSNYRNQQYQLLNKMQSFSQQLPELLDALAENGPSDAVAAFGEQLLSISLAGEQSGASTAASLTLSSLSSSDLNILMEMLSETPLTDSQLQMLQTGSLSQRDALMLLRDAAAAGTLKLPENCTQAEMAAKTNEITLALGLPDTAAPLADTGNAGTLSELTGASPLPDEANPAPLPDSYAAGEDTSSSATADTGNSAFSLAGKLFHNLSDAARSSFQTLNQNLNQMLASPANGSIAITHTPSVIDTMLSSVTANGREQGALFTYLTQQERTQLVDSLRPLPVSSRLTEKILSGEAETKEVFTAIRNLIPHSDSSAIGQLFQSDAFQRLFTQAMMESFTITPRQLAKKGEMDHFYQKLELQMDSFERLINTALSGDDSRQLSDQAHDMKSNIDFMKALNETFGYMQLPLKLQNQNTHGDLYVYTQKEKLKKHPDKISLLLHLEMEHLGTMDIRLEKDKQNIDARFTLDDHSSIQLIERNTHMLQDSLSEKGYTCNIQVQPKETEENPIRDFLNTKITTTATKEMKRFSFDIRA